MLSSAGGWVHVVRVTEKHSNVHACTSKPLSLRAFSSRPITKTALQVSLQCDIAAVFQAAQGPSLPAAAEKRVDSGNPIIVFFTGSLPCWALSFPGLPACGVGPCSWARGTEVCRWVTTFLLWARGAVKKIVWTGKA